MTHAGSKRVAREHEVIVLGAGPAGCAAATLLARRGHDVALVRPSAPPAGALAESIPPSARKLLAELDLLEDVERAGFHSNGGNTVWWAGGAPRTEAFPPGQGGFHADRAGIEDALVGSARRVGANVYERTTARSAEESGDGWHVRCASDDDAPVDLVATWVLDATGRRGVIARGEGRQPDRSTTTLALVRRWRREGGFADVSATHTLVESYVDGWAWSVPLGPDVRCFTAMVDHRHAELAATDLDAKLDSELDKAPHVGSSRRGAEPLGPAWACPASLYTAARFGRPGLLLVGDAGSFIDPLSSFGVKKALSSGWLAAVAVHTALVDPPMGEVAVGFFDDRERDVYRKYRALSAQFFEEGARQHRHEYWTSRAAASRAAGDDGSGQPGEPGDPVDPDALDESVVPVEAVRAAFECIRARERLDAVLGNGVRSLRRPAIAGQRIILTEHLASERVPAGLRYVRNVDLARLVDLAPLHAAVPDGWSAYNAGAASVALPDYLAALATAFAAGLLEHADDGPDGLGPQPEGTS